MNKKLLVVAFSAVMACPVMAQSTFEGFYGQIALGYQSNQFSSTSFIGGSSDTWTADNQKANGIPLVIGLSYNYSITPKWLMGFGVDYSVLSHETSTYKSTRTSDSATLDLAKLQSSNRVNIFVTSGHEIDKDKLVYLKAGYSMVDIKQTYPNYYTSSSGKSNTVSYVDGASQSKTADGYIVGLGYKQMITNGLYGFAEANYMNYSTQFSATTTGYSLSPSPTLNTHHVLVGVAYKF